MGTRSTTGARTVRPFEWRWLELLIVGTLGLVGFVALWLYSDGTPLDVLIAAIAMFGAVAVALLVPRQPTSAVGVVFLLAVFERLALQLPAGDMRLEQPALLTLIVAVGLYRSRLNLPPIRPLWPLIAAALIYLAVLTASSLLVADQPLASMRMVAWSTLSMVGGLITALVVAGRAGRVLPWISGSAAVVAIIGIFSAVGFLLFALGDPWVAGTETFTPKVNGLSHEPNLYASLLAAAIPLAAEMWRERPRLRNTVIVSVLLLAIGLGVTRAAYIGLAVGLVVYFALTVRREGFGADLKKLSAVISVTAIIGLLLPLLLLNPSREGMLIANPPRPPTQPPATSGSSPGFDLSGQLGTLGYRLDQVKVGFDEFAASPLIGRGAFSFGQRHTEPRGGPAVIAIWPFSVAYDAGIVGLVALSAFFVLLAQRVWRVARDKLLGGPAVAFGAAVAVLLVAYLATTALHFAVTWIFIGCAVGATIRWPAERHLEIDRASQGGLMWRATHRFTARSRRRRFATFMRLMSPGAEDTVLDVGVNDTTWRSSNFLEASYPWPSHITAVGPKPMPAFTAAFPDVRFVEADGRSLPFGDGSFDIGFSNAVVEHVGGRDEQRRLIAEMVRTCRRSFICTPNRWFPVDPHTLLPFAHWLPRRAWNAVLGLTGNGRWASVEALNPLSGAELMSYFPAGTSVRLERQRMLGMTSVLIAIAESTSSETGQQMDSDAR